MTTGLILLVLGCIVFAISKVRDLEPGLRSVGVVAFVMGAVVVLLNLLD
ncbi:MULTISPECIES: hypothetical protein [unclassified Aeromicrobium]